MSSLDSSDLDDVVSSQVKKHAETTDECISETERAAREVVAPGFLSSYSGLRELIIRYPVENTALKNMFETLLPLVSPQLHSLELSGEGDDLAMALGAVPSGKLKSLKISFGLLFGVTELDPLVDLLERTGRGLQFLHLRRTVSTVIDQALVAASKFTGSLTHIIVEADCSLPALRAVCKANAESLRVVRARLLGTHSFKFHDMWKPFRHFHNEMLSELNAVAQNEFHVPLSRLYGPNKNKFWESIIEYRCVAEKDAPPGLDLFELQPLYDACHPRDEDTPDSLARSFEVAMNAVVTLKNAKKFQNYEWVRRLLNRIVSVSQQVNFALSRAALLAVCSPMRDSRFSEIRCDDGVLLKDVASQLLTRWIQSDKRLVIPKSLLDTPDMGKAVGAARVKRTVLVDGK